jgi:hypothetical protein
MLLAIRLALLDGDKLPGNKLEFVHTLDGELQVFRGP